MVYLFIPSVGRWYVLSSVVRRYISFIVSGTSMNYPFLYHQWYGGIFLFMPSVERWYVLSSVVRRYISFIVSGTSMLHPFLYHQWYGGISLHAFSGTVVCVIVNGTAVHPFYIISDTVVYLFMPSMERWYVLSSMVRRYISFYIISGTVVYLFMPSVERWYVLSSVVRWYISSYHQWYDG